jgi:YVTN family beta-propeller protein
MLPVRVRRHAVAVVTRSLRHRDVRRSRVVDDAPMRARWATVLLGPTLAAAACGGSSGGGTAAPPHTPTAAPGPHSTVVARLHVGTNPCGVATANGAVWVSDAATGVLYRIDPTSAHVTTAAHLDATPCAITEDRTTLWVITQSGRLDRVDATTGKVVAHIPVGTMSYQAIVVGNHIWVSNRNSSTISIVDPATNHVVHTLPTPGVQPGGMVYAAGSAWVGDDTDTATAVLRIDPHTLKSTRVAAGQRPAYLTATPGAVWVSDVVDGSVTRIDTATSKSTAVVHAGSSPVNLAALPGATPEVWVPDDVGGHVTRIDASSAHVVETIDATGKGPAIVAPVDGDIWVTMFGAGEVWRIHPAPQ